MTKHYFAAGNTAQGFVNYFNNINDKSRKAKLYILKGGAGTGKSTLMKKIGKYFEENGEQIEYFYCSSDPQSLDGVRIVSKNAAIVDGTAPHVTEAEIAGVSDFIINLGECIGKGVGTHESEIRTLLARKSNHFYNVNRYLAAAGEIFNAKNRNYSQITVITRKLFIDSPEETGLYLKNGYNEVFEVNFDAFYEVNEFLTRQNSPVTVFSNYLNPDSPSAIEVGGTFIKFNYNDENCLSSIYYAKMELEKARAAHKEIEAFYYPYMDFDGLNKITAQIITEISELAIM